MKTIEISDELYDQLMDIVKEMTTQDNRCTAYPFFYQIRDWERVYDSDLNGSIPILIDRNGDYTTVESSKDLMEYLEYRDIEFDKEEINGLWEDYQTGFGWELEEYLEEKGLTDLEKMSYSLEPVYKNAFLTEKEAQRHLETNHYHYHPNADTYVNHAWRNYDMETLHKFITEIAPRSEETLEEKNTIK
jgi:hypothetical protein